MAVTVSNLTTMMLVQQETIDRLQDQASRRRSRSAILLNVINGLKEEVARIDAIKQSPEWQRHQVYAYGLKRFPSVSKELVGLGADYAIYYLHHGDFSLADEIVT